MHISSCQPGCSVLPFNIASAYGLKKPAAASGAANPAGAQIASPARNDLVAGRVRGGVDFETRSSANASVPPQVLSIYRRAADKVEAAVAVEVGRIIDLRG
jgi:hypothetical protein